MDLGVLTIAQNSSVDYVKLAYQQCRSLKTCSDLPYAVVTDQRTKDDMPASALELFDHVVVISDDLAAMQDWKLNNECQLFKLTPFRETLKVEADLVFTGSIDHWWRALRYRNMVVSQGCVDHLGRSATDRSQRRAFDANTLPDVYTGLMYWRRSQEAFLLFNTVRALQDNWQEVRKELKSVGELERSTTPSTDLIFALAIRMLGPETYTLPIDWFRMVHMKPSVCSLPDPMVPCLDQLGWSINDQGMVIAGHQQRHPVHHHHKEFSHDRWL